MASARPGRDQHVRHRRHGRQPDLQPRACRGDQRRLPRADGARAGPRLPHRGCATGPRHLRGHEHHHDGWHRRLADRDGEPGDDRLGAGRRPARLAAATGCLGDSRLALPVPQPDRARGLPDTVPPVLRAKPAGGPGRSPPDFPHDARSLLLTERDGDARIRDSPDGHRPRAVDRDDLLRARLSGRRRVPMGGVPRDRRRTADRRRRVGAAVRADARLPATPRGQSRHHAQSRDHEHRGTAGRDDRFATRPRPARARAARSRRRRVDGTAVVHRSDHGVPEHRRVARRHPPGRRRHRPRSPPGHDARGSGPRAAA